MHPEYEALLQAYDAAKQAGGEEAKQLIALYEARLEDALQKFPNLEKPALSAALRFAYPKWIKAQKRPSSMPPKA
jgi:ABC-type Fe3+-hydroxamate transport system substrate-binding protein